MCGADRVSLEVGAQYKTLTGKEKNALTLTGLLMEGVRPNCRGTVAAFQTGAWRTLLARELKAAGFQTDMNDV